MLRPPQNHRIHPLIIDFNLRPKLSPTVTKGFIPKCCWHLQNHRNSPQNFKGLIQKLEVLNAR